MHSDSEWIAYRCKAQRILSTFEKLHKKEGTKSPLSGDAQNRTEVTTSTLASPNVVQNLSSPYFKALPYIVDKYVIHHKYRVILDLFCRVYT